MKVWFQVVLCVLVDLASQAEPVSAPAPKSAPGDKIDVNIRTPKSMQLMVTAKKTVKLFKMQKASSGFDVQYDLNGKLLKKGNVSTTDGTFVFYHALNGEIPFLSVEDCPEFKIEATIDSQEGTTQRQRACSQSSEPGAKKLKKTTELFQKLVKRMRAL